MYDHLLSFKARACSAQFLWPSELLPKGWAKARKQGHRHGHRLVRKQKLQGAMLGPNDTDSLSFYKLLQDMALCSELMPS